MALTPLKARRVVKEGVNSGNQGREVNCLARLLEVEAGWSGVAEKSGGMDGIGRREVEDGADRWAPLGGDRGRRRRRRVAQCEKGNEFWSIHHCRAGRDGPSAHAACGREGRWPAGLRGRAGRMAAGPIGPKVKENSFPNKNWIFEFIKALEICRKKFRRNFGMRIFPKFF
jgi:hypothetical protein